jgi:hypothetical protein
LGAEVGAVEVDHHRAFDVTGRELLGSPDVENHDLLRAVLGQLECRRRIDELIVATSPTSGRGQGGGGSQGKQSFPEGMGTSH